jgi:hypothetical protein
LIRERFTLTTKDTKVHEGKALTAKDAKNIGEHPQLSALEWSTRRRELLTQRAQRTGAEFAEKLWKAERSR